MHPGTSGSRKGVYRAGLDNPVFDEQKRSAISVKDIAVALLDETEDLEHIGVPPFSWLVNQVYN